MVAALIEAGHRLKLARKEEAAVKEFSRVFWMVGALSFIKTGHLGVHFPSFCFYRGGK